MREFYELGIPEDVKARDVVYLEKGHSSTAFRSGRTRRPSVA